MTKLIQILDDIVTGFIVGSSHGFWFLQDWIQKNLIRPSLYLIGLDDDVVLQGDGDKTLKVIGVGYGRTGTYSLALALEELGYPTLHTQHMHENRDIIDMWTNQVFDPSITSGEATLGRPNLQVICQHGYTATMDLPTALYFEQVMEQYPQAKYILTTRESSDVWFKSWDMLTKAITVPTHWFGWMWHAKKINNYYRWLFSIINQDNFYLEAPLPLPPQEEKKAKESYEAHNARVRNVIPPELLLEYSVKQGWEPLCGFLQVENCPTHKAFPKSNSALSVQVQTVSAMVVPIALTFVVIRFVVLRVMRKRKQQTTNGDYTSNGSDKSKRE